MVVKCRSTRVQGGEERINPIFFHEILFQQEYFKEKLFFVGWLKVQIWEFTGILRY